MRISKLDFETRYTMARNPNTSKERLNQLANDKSFWIRYEVAKNQNTDQETLGRLAVDNDWYVCIAAIGNPNISPKTLNRLAHYGKKHCSFYCEIARNPRTSQETLDYLADNESEYVRNEVARNPHTGLETLYKLAK